MKGEQLGWLRLASHLHLSLQRTKMETSSTEFVVWMEYLRQDANVFHRMDYYLAQIAAEVRRLYVKYPKKVKLSDFLLKFKFEDEKRVRKKMSLKKRTDMAKKFWSTVLGFKQKR